MGVKVSQLPTIKSESMTDDAKIIVDIDDFTGTITLKELRKSLSFSWRIYYWLKDRGILL
jgi:hypothetical protein